jgi:DNA polymerase III delta prime subunit
MRKKSAGLLKAVKGQDIAVRMLENELNYNRLPGALLFHGPVGSGKFFTSIELSRTLNCAESGHFDCTCPSCTQTRKLLSRNVFLITRGDLKNIFNLWKRFGVKKEKIDNFIYDVRRLVTSIYHEDRHGRDLSVLEDTIRFRGEKIDNFQEVIDCIYRVLDSYKGKLISINSIRELQKFLSLKSGDAARKVVIIEGAERMTEEAANSFLKISEETPPNALIIITTVDKDLLKDTINSRFRAYRFIGLNDNVYKDVLLSHFGYEEKRALVEKKYDIDIIGAYIERIRDQGLDLESLTEIIDEIIAKGHTISFLDYTLDSLREKIADLHQSNMGNIYDLEVSIKNVSFIKRSIVVNNVNQEIALTDFILNNFFNVIKILQLV